VRLPPRPTVRSLPAVSPTWCGVTHQSAILLAAASGSLIRTRELGAAVAGRSGDSPGCLIPQHGIVTVGPDAATAVMRAILLARACDVQLRAMAPGSIKRWSSSAELDLKRREVWPSRQFAAGRRYWAGHRPALRRADLRARISASSAHRAVARTFRVGSRLRLRLFSRGYPVHQQFPRGNRGPSCPQSWVRAV
jgi:Class II Aldolase and Adducin N-terminal domain